MERKFYDMEDPIQKFHFLTELKRVIELKDPDLVKELEIEDPDDDPRFEAIIEKFGLKCIYADRKDGKIHKIVPVTILPWETDSSKED